MKRKFQIKVLGKLALSFGIQLVLAYPASSQAALIAFAGTHGLIAEKTEYLPTVDLPFTQYVYNYTEVNSGVSGAAVATCPDDSIVVGGGYAADADVTFYTQYKYGNGWRGDAQNNSGSKQQITVYAVCLHNLSGISVTQVHGQDDVASGLKANAIATCPAGSLATGGGFHAYPDGSLRVYNSSRAYSGEGWQSWAQNLSGSTKTLHAYAMCLSGSGGMINEILESVSIPPNGTGYAFLTCPSGSLVTGGGFAAQDYMRIYISSGPHPGNEWHVHVRNTHSSDDKTLFAYAICLSLPDLPQNSVYLPIILDTE